MADAREQHRRPRATDPVPAAQHYFTPVPAVPSAPRRVELVLPDTRFDLETDRGVFSPNRIDAGTKLLLLEDPLRDELGLSGPGREPASRTFVDLGCGYGAIALTLARRHPDATIWAVDVNERALALCRANAAAHGLANVVVGREDELPAAGAGGAISAVYSNPPIRVGKAALQDLLDRWAARLSPGGRMLLVVRRDLGAESLERWLAERGWAPSRLAARAGYRVLQARPCRSEAP